MKFNITVNVLHDVTDRVAALLRCIFACPRKPHFRFSRLTLSPGPAIFEGEFILQDITITDLQSIAGTLVGVDAEGHETADLSGVTVTAESSNTAVCSAAISGDQLTIAADGSDLGLAQVTLNATLADGSTVSDVVNVTVTASAAAGIKANFGAPTP